MWARWYISTASATRKRAESYQTFGFTGSAWNAMAELPRRDRQGLSRTSSSSVAGGTPNCVRLVRGIFVKEEFENLPKRGYLDFSEEPLPPVPGPDDNGHQEGDEAPDQESEAEVLPSARRVRAKTSPTPMVPAMVSHGNERPEITANMEESEPSRSSWETLQARRSLPYTPPS